MKGKPMLRDPEDHLIQDFESNISKLDLINQISLNKDYTLQMIDHKWLSFGVDKSVIIDF